MRPTEQRQDHLLDLEADDAGRVLPTLDARQLHDQRQPGVCRRPGIADTPQLRHATHVQLLFEPKLVDLLARLQGCQLGLQRCGGHWPCSSRWASLVGKPAANILATALCTS
jgi:hypothetical protein